MSAPFESLMSPAKVRMGSYDLDRAQLIDDFRYVKENSLKSELVRMQPALPALSQYHSCHLAATVDALCDEAGIDRPRWTSFPIYVMSPPVYPPLLKDFTPMTDYIDAHICPVFLEHGIKIDDDVLRRA